MNLQISIVVPIYNVEKYLCRCLKSIIAQTFTSWECILVDDGSTDNSYSICQKYAAIDSRFKVLHKKNKGVSSARNAGLDEVQGKYVCFIDSDDWVSSQYLSHMYSVIETDNSDLVITGHIRVNDDGAEFNFKYADDLIEHERFADIFLKHNLQKHGSPWSKLFKTEIIKDLRFNPEVHLGEDIIYLYNYILNTNKISFSSYSDYYYVYRTGSLTLRMNSYESEWKGWQEYYKVSNMLRYRFVGEEAYIRSNSNTVFIERVINAIIHDSPNRETRFRRLKLIDWQLYKRCKISHTWKESILKFLLVHNLFVIYDFLINKNANK